jgi:threonine dehydratase
MTAETRRPQRDVAAPDRRDLLAALTAVRSQLEPTPLVDSPSAGALLKLEAAQPTGSFKVRGALAALTAAAPDTPIVTASTGNHALAVAWAADRLRRRATVVVPETASDAKLGQLARFTASVVRHGASFDAAEAHALARAAENGAAYLSAYNDRHVIAGQATIGAELESLLDDPLTIVCPVGGGGLLAGLCRWAADRSNVTLIGVEPEASRAMSAAVRAGRAVTVPVGATLADGVAGNLEPGSVTVDIVRARVDDLLTVTEEEIAGAVRHLVREHGLVAEGAGAVAAAALLTGRVRARGTCVALVSGRNIAPAALASVLAGR